VRKILAIIILAVAVTAIWLSWAVFSPVRLEGTIFITVKPGSTARQIASMLDDAGVIHSHTAFLIYHSLTGRHSLKAGDYEFTRPSSLPDLYSRLERGDVFVKIIVIPEGYNIFDIATSMADAKICSRSEFLQIARSETSLILDLSPHATSLEGFLFPDTYQFSRTATCLDVASTMVKRFRKEALSIGLARDLQRTVTLASFVEKETRLPEERPLVAGVFENRLQKKMPLATDPSVIYAAELAGSWTGVIHQSDLQRNSPYNTYKFSGLPPGPIANPGRSALEAALHPARTSYLYFVADNTGGHNFAHTKEEHDQNVAAYRKGVAKHINR